jgi:hypothetical protein
MMLVFAKDERSLTAFPSDYEVKVQCELIDVQNGEFEFCEDNGQRYAYAVTKSKVLFGLISSETYILVPEGVPDIQNVMRLIDKTRHFDGKRCGIGSIDELKAQALKRKGAL